MPPSLLAKSEIPPAIVSWHYSWVNYSAEGLNWRKERFMKIIFSYMLLLFLAILFVKCTRSYDPLNAHDTFAYHAYDKDGKEIVSEDMADTAIGKTFTLLLTVK